MFLQDLFKKSKETSDIANLMAKKAGTSVSANSKFINTKMNRGEGASDSNGSDSGGAGTSRVQSSPAAAAKRKIKHESTAKRIKYEDDGDDDDDDDGESPVKKVKKESNRSPVKQVCWVNLRYKCQLF